MRPWAALVAALLTAVAGPAFAADPHGFEGSRGWRHHGHHHKHHHHAERVYQAETVEVVEYREPHLPRGILYNAPPLPLAHAYGYRRGYRDVISAKY